MSFIAWPSRKNDRHQWHFAGPTRPIEELYGSSDRPAEFEKPRRLQGTSKSSNASATPTVNIRDTVDWGFLPESEAWVLPKNP